ncbi:hypothetical protein L208DRAFT_1374184 [Tricholoma matsutake]|nr:hypothetical protein L208DRAFT_1374184 [Tricholoma matsutake 945]
MQYCNILTVLQLGQASLSTQKVANMVLKHHIRQSLQKYLNTSDLVVNFLLAMQSSDTVVYMSFALWILIGDQGKGWVLNNLNIAIPKGKVKPLSVLLSAQGYQEEHYGVGWQWEQSVRTYIHFVHLVLHRTVVLCESATWTVLPVVLSASSMASMIAVIPHLAGYRVPKDGARLLHLQRGMRGVRGIQILTWNEDGEEGTKLEKHMIKWGIGTTCQNIWCPLFGWKAM